MFQNIIDPKTGFKYSTNSVMGKHIINHYVKTLRGGSDPVISSQLLDSRQSCPYRNNNIEVCVKSIGMEQNKLYLQLTPSATLNTIKEQVYRYLHVPPAQQINYLLEVGDVDGNIVELDDTTDLSQLYLYQEGAPRTLSLVFSVNYQNEISLSVGDAYSVLDGYPGDWRYSDGKEHLLFDKDDAREAGVTGPHLRYRDDTFTYKFSLPGDSTIQDVKNKIEVLTQGTAPAAEQGNYIMYEDPESNDSDAQPGFLNHPADWLTLNELQREQRDYVDHYNKPLELRYNINGFLRRDYWDGNRWIRGWDVAKTNYDNGSLTPAGGPNWRLAPARNSWLPVLSPLDDRRAFLILIVGIILFLILETTN